MVEFDAVDPNLPSELAATLRDFQPSEASDATSPADLDDGKRYEDRGLLGTGGMGEVRVCRDRRIGRDVALKLAHAGLPGEDDLRMRFVREARVQGQLEHPSIVPVYDFGVTEHGDAYFTMKRVRGQTLEAILEGLRAGDAALAQKLTRRKLLTAFTSVCLSVDFAHSRGVLHRDLKPSNIMLGDFGEVYVLDWGIAKVVGSPDSGRDPALSVSVESVPTAVGSLLGTPGYMAPEQITGGDLDERTEVYSLGAILFETLTYEPLHPRASIGSIITATVAGADARASKRAPHREVPPELEALTVRATATDPSGRPASARELADAVERFLDGDRDLMLRRTMAVTHAEAAAQLADEALRPGREADVRRREALQEVGKALAFDPAHVGARQTLLRLLTTAPSEMPAEAAAQRERVHADQERLGARIGAGAYVAWLLGALLLLWVGVRDWVAFGLFLAAQALATAACVWRARAPRSGGAPFVAVRVAMTLASVSLCTIFGPLVILPAVAVGTTVSLLLHPSKHLRVPIIAAGCLATLLPLALQWWGVLPASYAFESGSMIIRPWMTPLPEAPTIVAIVSSSVGTTLAAAFLVVRVRDALTDAEERLALQAWQLGQLVSSPSAPGG